MIFLHANRQWLTSLALFTAGLWMSGCQNLSSVTESASAAAKAAADAKAKEQSVFLAGGPSAGDASRAPSSDEPAPIPEQPPVDVPIDVPADPVPPSAGCPSGFHSVGSLRAQAYTQAFRAFYEQVVRGAGYDPKRFIPIGESAADETVAFSFIVPGNSDRDRSELAQSGDKVILHLEMKATNYLSENDTIQLNPRLDVAGWEAGLAIGRANPYGQGGLINSDWSVGDRGSIHLDLSQVRDRFLPGSIQDNFIASGMLHVSADDDTEVDLAELIYCKKN